MKSVKTRLTTTQIPTTTPATEPPPPDPYEYERSHFKGNLTDARIEFLKDIVRVHHGQKTTELVKPPDADELAFIEPRSNETSRLRTEVRLFRLLHRCGGGATRPLTDADERNMHDAASQRTVKLADKLDAMMKQARQLTVEEVDELRDRVDLERLRETALRVRHESGYRGNACSKFRLRLLRGQPIITSSFRKAYDDYFRPPFVLSKFRRMLSRRHLPPIKPTQMWLTPVDEDASIPLHSQPKEIVPDGRSRKERSRPPLKARSRELRIEKVAANKKGKRKLPWNYGVHNRC